jgi:adenosylhomocysteine nucleosidase
MNKPLIFTALQMEARAIAGALAKSQRPFDLEVIGIRACRLPRDLAQRGASCIIMAGLAGALDPTLKIGDVVLDDAIHTSDRLITTAAEKANLFRQTNCRAVDMENAIVRAAAAAAGISFIGIRAISDTADQAVDPRVLKLVDEVGRPRPLAIAGLLLRRPTIIGQLRRLHSDSATALESLGRAVRAELFRTG